jgi:hypothetical protein
MDNGFDLDRGRDGDWLVFGSSHVSLQIWLAAVRETLFVVALSRSDVSAAAGHGGVRFDQRGDDCLGNFRMRLRRLVPMNMDSPGSSPGQAQVKSGMTEWGRTNPGSFSRPSPRSRIRHPGLDPGPG